MLTVVPMSVLLLGVLGLAVMVASVARMIVLERTTQGPALLDRGPRERPRVAA
jgi:hypothetical protein